MHEALTRFQSVISEMKSERTGKVLQDKCCTLGFNCFV